MVSIIIPVYNREHLLAETLESIILQTYPNWECILVDDNSTDNSIEIIKQYIQKDHRFTFYSRPSNYGAGGNGARNYGFEVSTGEFINWFDSDDVMLPNFLESKITAMEDDLEFVIAGGFFWDGNSTGNQMKIYEYNDFYTDLQTWRLQIITNSILFRKRFLINKELFSEKMYRAQETEFFSRIFFNIKEDIFKIINEPTFLYRQHQGSITQKNKSYNSKFLSSLAKLNIDNIERSIESKNTLLLKNQYGLLLSRFFQALKNSDLENANLIKDNGKVKLRDMSKSISFLFAFFCNISIKFKNSRYVTERILHRLQLLFK